MENTSHIREDMWLEQLRNSEFTSQAEIHKFQDEPDPMKLSDLPKVKEEIEERINSCKEKFSEIYDKAQEKISEIAENLRESVIKFDIRVVEGLKDYLCGIKGVDEFLKKDSSNMENLNEKTTEVREFGLDKCTEAAMEIFNPGIINEWGNLSDAERKGIALEYADKVANAFELDNYKGVYIEELGEGILGYNNGDGTIHLSPILLSNKTTPFQIIDTITHELRHQYQSECVEGLHNVSDEVRTEWTVSRSIYNYDQPSCYDPWGYAYNPLEIDARYAGNTVVRNVSSKILNDVAANNPEIINSVTDDVRNDVPFACACWETCAASGVHEGGQRMNCGYYS